MIWKPWSGKEKDGAIDFGEKETAACRGAKNFGEKETAACRGAKNSGKTKTAACEKISPRRKWRCGIKIEKRKRRIEWKPAD